MPVLGTAVLGSTLEHMQWEESKAGLKRNLRASPNEYGNSEERVNETQVKKALFCRGLACYKGDSRWPSLPGTLRQHWVSGKDGQETWPRWWGVARS